MKDNNQRKRVCEWQNKNNISGDGCTRRETFRKLHEIKLRIEKFSLNNDDIREKRRRRIG